MGSLPSGKSCRIIAPSPYPDASVSTMNGASQFGVRRTGWEVHASLSVFIAVCSRFSHFQACPLRVRSLGGLAISEKFGMNAL